MWIKAGYGDWFRICEVMPILHVNLWTLVFIILIGQLIQGGLKCFLVLVDEFYEQINRCDYKLYMFKHGFSSSRSIA